MKEQDLIHALSNLPQDLLDELDEWQKSGAPLTDTNSKNDSPARTKRPVITQRRNNHMKQKTEKSPMRLRAWTAGIAAAVVICSAVAIPVGKEAIRRSGQNSAGYAESETVEPVENTSDEKAAEEEFLTAGQPGDAEQVPENAFYAWYWTGYRGDDISLEGRTIAVIRTAADCKPYLTGSGQQDETTLEAVLSADWLEQAYPENEAITDPVSGGQIYSDGQPHDVIFIGIPENELPHNTVRLVYHNGTLTPSGKLHIDISILTVTDEIAAALPADMQCSGSKCRYFFVSVPDGELPELSDADITFTAYHADALPPEYAADSSDTVWFDSLPAVQNWWGSVLGSKYIYRIPEAQQNILPVADTSVRVTDEPSMMQQAREYRSEILPVDDETDELRLVLPVHDASAITALSDVRVSADGIISLTLNECYDSQNIDEEKDNACVCWQMRIPKGSLPEISGGSLNRVTMYDETEFMHIAGQMLTITKG